MTPKNILKVSALASVLMFMGVGCISFSGGGTANVASDGGVFKSVNKGDNWVQKVAVPTTTGAKASISGTSITTIVQDPQDQAAFYVGTVDNGMFYSYDGGESWFQPKDVSRGRIPAIAVDPKQKCTVYATSEHKLLKSEDCNRTWTVVYVDARADRKTSYVLVDHFNTNIIWLANGSGDLYKSADGGASWALVKNFNNNPIIKMVASPSDSRRLYVATKSAGVWRSDDAGSNWKDLSRAYTQFPAAGEFGDIALGVSDTNIVVLATKFGLIRSMDGGDAWDKIDLLTPAGTTQIYSLAIDPKDPNSIYYGTSTTFYRTANGGTNWVPKKLPTSRTATAMMVDRTNSAVLYMGVTRFKQ